MPLLLLLLGILVLPLLENIVALRELKWYHITLGTDVALVPVLAEVLELPLFVLVVIILQKLLGGLQLVVQWSLLQHLKHFAFIDIVTVVSAVDRG